MPNQPAGPVSHEDLLKSPVPQIRLDACHYLGLSGDPDVAEAISPLLDDDDPQVREVARETLEALSERRPAGGSD